MLVLPGDPLFLQTLASPIPGINSRSGAFVCRLGSDLLEFVEGRALEDYLEGGEYEEREEEIGENPVGSNLLYLPESITITSPNY